MKKDVNSNSNAGTDGTTDTGKSVNGANDRTTGNESGTVDGTDGASGTDGGASEVGNTVGGGTVNLFGIETVGNDGESGEPNASGNSDSSGGSGRGTGRKRGRKLGSSGSGNGTTGNAGTTDNGNGNGTTGNNSGNRKSGPLDVTEVENNVVSEKNVEDYSKTTKVLKTRGKNSKKTDFVELKSNIKDGVSLFFGFVALRGGSHWYLTDEESEKFADKSVKALEAFPENKLFEWAEKYEKYVPVGALILTAGTMTVPRIMQTVNNQNVQSSKVNRTIQQNAGTPANVATGRTVENVSRKSDAGFIPNDRADARTGHENGINIETGESSISQYLDLI